MYKKTIKYTDYDGNEREEDFYFNMNKLNNSTLGGSFSKAPPERCGPGAFHSDLFCALCFHNGM